MVKLSSMAGYRTRTEVEQLKQQEPQGSFPGLGRTPGTLHRQVNMDGHNQGEGGKGRNQIRDNKIIAEEGAQDVGASNVGNVQGPGGSQGGGHDICGNTITAGKRASNVGLHNIGNTTPDKGFTCCIL